MSLSGLPPEVEQNIAVWLAEEVLGNLKKAF